MFHSSVGKGSGQEEISGQWGAPCFFIPVEIFLIAR